MSETGTAPAGVKLQLSGARDVGSELMSLREWLSSEPEFRGHLYGEGEESTPGAMGAVSDVLVVALGSGGAMTVLFQSLNAWLQARRPEVSVDVTNPDGSTVRISASGSAATKVVDNLKPPP